MIPEDVWVTKFQTAQLAKDVPDVAPVYTSGYVGSFQPLDDTLFAHRTAVATGILAHIDQLGGFDGEHTPDVVIRILLPMYSEGLRWSVMMWATARCGSSRT